MSVSIHLNKLGKRFNREWIFRDLSYEITPSEKLVVTGSNGSGKSTLLLVLSGYVMPTEGVTEWKADNGTSVERTDYFKLSSFASPAMELIEEFTPEELIKHQSAFKKFQFDLSDKEVLEIAELEKNKNKLIKNFSSGMKQRLKLSMAILADCPVLLLDEPITNLDRQAIEWYLNMIAKYAMHKTIIVCSNQIKDEYAFCTKEISINDYKK
ncbi:MAG: ATP-binding cassette domain-containing protein [Bacteroidota bacterium]|nr:ATP-binding cassette domain-containing protein [Bacteroidota bacterium]